MALSPVRPRASMSVGSADTIALTRSYSPALIASMNAAAAAASVMGRFYLSGRNECGSQRRRRPLALRPRCCRIKLSTAEDAGDAEEESRLNRFEPPILRVPR